MQRVVVLGAGGFLGTPLVAALAAGGWAAPVAVSRRPRTGTERLACDATDADALRRALDGADAVVNCMAGRPAAMVAVARNLANAPAACRIVQLSSMAVYGPATGLADEVSRLPEGLTGYAGAKVAAEHALAGHPGRVILRPGCIYGPGSEPWTNRIARLLQARRLGDLGAGGDGTCNLAFVDDVVAAILAALQRPVRGATFNVAMPAPPSWNGYLTQFALALGAVPVARIPGRRLRLETRLAVPLRAAAALAGPARRLARHVPLPPDAIPPSLAALMRQEIVLNHRRADAGLGFPRTALGAGLARAAWPLLRRPPGPHDEPADQVRAA